MTETAPPTPGTSTVERWAAVMTDLGHLAKGERAQAGATKFNFRGIDAVMNALGPILRKHQVIVVPHVLNHWREPFESKAGGRMMGTIVEVSYTIQAAGSEDVVIGAAFGEASDAGDKSMPKAMSVAYRTFLLQALTLPTDEPDPDHTIVERASANPTAKPDEPDASVEQVDEIKDLADRMGFDEVGLRSGIQRYTGRAVLPTDLTTQEADRVLVPLRRAVQSREAAPDGAMSERRIAEALGGATAVAEQAPRTATEES